MPKEPTKVQLAAVTEAKNSSAAAALEVFINRIRPPPTPQQIPCPYVYAKGKRCTGHVVRVEAFKVDIEWRLDQNGQWGFGWGQPRSHYHLYCSEKDSHARHGQDDALKFFYSDLPEEIKKIVGR